MPRRSRDPTVGAALAATAPTQPRRMPGCERGILVRADAVPAAPA
ncbi:hypothetical protein GLE_3037 [Lysobacter enzymogenes]|uniref:Uncharacterized protein n=1 Tax=Lysobacter enzymogenes TaxID=69 RepID=A0A0S2DIR7_LYSEN|nr:hypothetical protein GLE_3037 [Lysobacter enzymogenes]